MDPIKELHYLCSTDNLRSILEKGILSHNAVQDLIHEDISNQGVQNNRATKDVVYKGANRPYRKVHDHAVLFFNGMNPMIYEVQKNNPTIIFCVLRIHPSLLLEKGVIISDRNAATTAVRFQLAAQNLNLLSQEIIFNNSWRDKNETPEVNKERGQIRAAEVLVDTVIPAHFICGAYVKDDVGKTKCRTILKEMGETSFPLQVLPNFFKCSMGYDPLRTPTLRVQDVALGAIASTGKPASSVNDSQEPEDEDSSSSSQSFDGKS